MHKIDPIKNIIDESGNNFHCKVVRYFTEKGWYVLVSPYYTDFVTDKPREIDIITEKVYPIHANFNIIYISVKLYVECKYIPHEVVFWFSDKDKKRSKDWLLKHTPITENNVYINKHHYNNEKNTKVAKLFASSFNKQIENETIFRAINQCLNATIYNKFSSSIIPNNKTKITKILHYPVIVFNSFDKFYRVDMDVDNEPLKIDDSFQHEINYAYLNQDKKSRNEYFLIDFVEFIKLDNFLDIIEQDVLAIGNFY